MKALKTLNFRNVKGLLVVLFFVATVYFATTWYLFHPESTNTITPTMKLLAEGSIDQDDMCIWIHPTESSKSTIITADKAAEKIFVYDLEGSVLQVLSMPKPGNIDVRYGFPLGGKKVDIVAYLQRKKGDRIIVFAIEPETRQLRRVDDNSIATGEGVGGTLYHSQKTDKFYFIKTTENKGTGGIEQFELFDDGKGKISGRKVRQWDLAGCEGTVADDESCALYIAQEDTGVWKVGAEPGDPTPGELIIKTWKNGLMFDVEGLTIYKSHAGEGYLMVSNQSRNSVKVYQLGGEDKFLGTFHIDGAIHTDGIDVTNVYLGTRFPKGLFVCHTDQKDSNRCPVLVTPWESIARVLNLKADVSWNPRSETSNISK
ncbi:MAG: phytase [Syntrophales bacterium]|nr:phytase [Syntrophales bacterium]